MCKNVCCVEYKNEYGINIKKVFTSDKNNHSEENMINFLKQNNIPGENIIKIFTEREPCVGATTNIYHNCTKLIMEYAPDAEVTYAIDYGVAKEDGRNARKALGELLKKFLDRGDKR